MYYNLHNTSYLVLKPYKNRKLSHTSHPSISPRSVVDFSIKSLLPLINPWSLSLAESFVFVLWCDCVTVLPPRQRDLWP